jgi:hypothetical protein
VVDDTKTVGECTTDELMELLSDRCPGGMVLAALVPDDQGTCGTVTVISGNRAACWGLASLLGKLAEKRMMDSRRTDADDEDEDDDDSDDDDGG